MDSNYSFSGQVQTCRLAVDVLSEGKVGCHVYGVDADDYGHDSWLQVNLMRPDQTEAWGIAGQRGGHQGQAAGSGERTGED